MKATTFAVAAAGLLGSVTANDWEDWGSEDTVDAVTTPAADGGYSWPAAADYSKTPEAVTTSTWSEWTTSKPVEPETTSTTTWSEWTTSSKPVEDTTTSTSTWSEWTTSTTKPVDATTKPAENTWSAWSSAQPVEASSQPSKPDSTETTLLTSTVYSTITVYPNEDTTVTVTQSNVVTKTGSPDQCVSYGAPTWTPTPAAAQSSTWSAWSAPASSAAPSSSAPASSTWATWSPPKSTGISSNGNKFGMTYSPYTSEGKCKDAETVKADIAKIASLEFYSVRVYSTDCDTLPNVGGAAKEHGLKLILGVFISETGINGAKPQVDEIIAWGQWDLVELIVIGNEAVFQGFCSASDLAGFISSSSAAFKGAGYQGACTTTDELSVWQEHGSEWCGVIDVVAANLYAFFNPEVTADMAGDFIQRQINDLNKVCPDKDSYVMESGWPSAAYGCNGAACASPENQAIAIKGIQETSGSKVVFFSFEDEHWKPDGQFGAEKHFGCASVFE